MAVGLMHSLAGLCGWVAIHVGRRIDTVLCWGRGAHKVLGHWGHGVTGLVVAGQGRVIKAIVSVVVLQAASTIIQYCGF